MAQIGRAHLRLLQSAAAGPVHGRRRVRLRLRGSVISSYIFVDTRYYDVTKESSFEAGATIRHYVTMRSTYMHGGGQRCKRKEVCRPGYYRTLRDLQLRGQGLRLVPQRRDLPLQALLPPPGPWARTPAAASALLLQRQLCRAHASTDLQRMQPKVSLPSRKCRWNI